MMKRLYWNTDNNDSIVIDYEDDDDDDDDGDDDDNYPLDDDDDDDDGDCGGSGGVDGGDCMSVVLPSNIFRQPLSLLADNVAPMTSRFFSWIHRF